MDDGDETTGLPGDDAAAPPYRGWTEAPTDEAYAGMWARYRDGMRDCESISRACKVSYRTVYTAIHRGWPEEHWPALKERLQLWERQRKARRQKELEADQQAAGELAKTEAQIWTEFRQRANHLVKEAETVLTGMGKKIRDAVELSTFVKYRRVRHLDKATGTVHVIDQAYVDGLALAKAAALWTGSIKDMPQVMKALLGDKAFEAPPAPPDFTAEQLEKMARGELPDGVTEQQVAIALMAAQQKASGGGE